MRIEIDQSKSVLTLYNPVVKYSTKSNRLDLGDGNLLKLITLLQTAVNGTPEDRRESLQYEIKTDGEWLSLEIWYEVEND